MSNPLIIQIYLITNTVNGKYYVGRTVQPLANYLRHNIAAATRGNSGKPFLYNAIRKYGADNFVIQLLTTVDNQEGFHELERCWIVALNARDRQCGYNVAPGGEGFLPGVTPWNKGKTGLQPWNKGNTGGIPWNKGKTGTMSLEGRQRISEAHKNNSYWVGRRHTEEARRKMADAKRGKKLSLGHKHSEESKQKMSEARKEWWASRYMETSPCQTL